MASLSSCSLFDSSDEKPVRVAWERPFGSEEGGHFRAGVTSQSVFVQAGGRILALDIASGSELWSRQARVLPVNAENIIVAGGLVVFAGGDSVRALDEATGVPRWSHLPDGNVAHCQIATAGGVVFVGSRVASVTALSLTNGQVLWNRALGPGWPFEAIVRGVAVSGDTLYVSIIRFLDLNGFRRTGLVVALDAGTGNELWRYTSPGDTSDVSPPMVTSDAVLLGDVYGSSFFALDRLTGVQRWRVPTPRQNPGVHHGPVVRDGVVFAGSQGGIFAVDEMTGQVRWSRTDLFGVSDVALCGNVLLAQGQRVWVLEPSTGRLLDTILEPSGLEVIISPFAVSGSRAFVNGYEAAYGLHCS